MLQRHQQPQAAAHPSSPSSILHVKHVFISRYSRSPSFQTQFILHTIPSMPSLEIHRCLHPSNNILSVSLSLSALPPPQPRPNNIPNDIFSPNNVPLPLDPPPRLNLQHHRPRPPLLVNHRQSPIPRAPRPHRLHHQPRRLTRRLFWRGTKTHDVVAARDVHLGLDAEGYRGEGLWWGVGRWGCAC